MNTLKYAKKLEAVGFSREQAEMTIGILSEVVDTELATRQDLKDVRGEITVLRSEMVHEFQLVRAEIKDLENRLTIKMGAMIVASQSILFALLKLSN